MTLRCLLGHDTRIVTEGDEGHIVCRRCGDVLDSWPLLRPEQARQAALTHAEVIADRERRAQAMQPKAARVLRIQR